MNARLNRTVGSLCGLSLLALSSLPAFAGHEHKDNPCRPVFEACEKAGFVHGDDAPDGREMWDDCKEPLLDGKTVTGVKVEAKEVRLCKQFKEDKKAWMKRWKDEHKS